MLGTQKSRGHSSLFKVRASLVWVDPADLGCPPDLRDPGLPHGLAASQLFFKRWSPGKPCGRVLELAGVEVEGRRRGEASYSAVVIPNAHLCHSPTRGILEIRRGQHPLPHFPVAENARSKASRALLGPSLSSSWKAGWFCFCS